jgi:hypothetical protein
MDSPMQAYGRNQMPNRIMKVEQGISNFGASSRRGLGMGVFFQKRKTRWTMRGGSNNVGRAERFPVVPT